MSRTLRKDLEDKTVVTRDRNRTILGSPNSTLYSSSRVDGDESLSQSGWRREVVLGLWVFRFLFNGSDESSHSSKERSEQKLKVGTGRS